MVDGSDSGEWYLIKYVCNLLNRSLNCEVSAVWFCALYFPPILPWCIGVIMESGVLPNMFPTI